MAKSDAQAAVSPHPACTGRRDSSSGLTYQTFFLLINFFSFSILPVCDVLVGGDAHVNIGVHTHTYPVFIWVLGI